MRAGAGGCEGARSGASAHADCGATSAPPAPARPHPQADCPEALYNLGLVCGSSGVLGDAVRAFDKLRSLAPGAPEPLSQLLDIHAAAAAAAGEGGGSGGQGGTRDLHRARAAAALLLAAAPADAHTHARLGDLRAAAGDEAGALAAYSAAHAAAPVSAAVARWLAEWHERAGLLERGAALFQDAARCASPASALAARRDAAHCWRRAGALATAYEGLAEALNQAPGDADCLRGLLELAVELGRPTEAHAAALAAAEAKAAGRAV